MKGLLRSAIVLLLFAWVGIANADTHTAIVTDVTKIPLDFQGSGPTVQDTWYENSATQFALLARTRTPELASPVLYSDIHNVCQFQVAVQNTKTPNDRTYGIIVRIYAAVDDTDSGPSGDPLVLADTGPDFLVTSDSNAWLVTFTVQGDCPEWDPNTITFPDASSQMGNWLSVMYQGDASGPNEDNATHTANGPADPLSSYFFSVDDRMMRTWPLDGQWGFYLIVAE